MLSARRSLAAGIVAGAAVSSGGAPARAEDLALAYTTPAAPNYLRAAIEEVGLLGLGLVQYTSTRSNEGDWDVRTDWSGVRSKLVWGVASLDDNRFDTNWLTHPGAGFLYYSVARSNRLGVFSSFAISTLASTTWETIGEIREQIALNDVIVTPVSSLSLGESALQLGSFFQRGRRTAPLVALGWLFAPIKSTHDAIDGLTPQGAYVVDDLGFPADVWHRFTIGGSAGVTSQQRGPRSVDERAFVQSELVTVPGYHQAGRRTLVFGAAEVTSLRLGAGVSRGDVVDLAFAASAMPGGWYSKDVEVGPDGRLRGSELLTGLYLSAEYTLHDYDRDGRRPRDRIALVGAGGAVAQTVHAGRLTLRTRLEILGDFAGVEAYALPEYQRASGDLGLTSVMRNHHYYHAYGATVRPRLEAALGRFDAGGEARFDAFRAIDRLAVEGPVPSEVAAADRRVSARTWIGVRPWRHLRVSLSGELGERAGDVGFAHASRTEAGAHLGTELVF